jgi:hypothetical protein
MKAMGGHGLVKTAPSIWTLAGSPGLSVRKSQAQHRCAARLGRYFYLDCGRKKFGKWFKEEMPRNGDGSLSLRVVLHAVGLGRRTARPRRAKQRVFMVQLFFCCILTKKRNASFPNGSLRSPPQF